MEDVTASFIDDAFLAKLEKLKIATKKSPRGVPRGEHRSWQMGEGSEFLDYRKYHVGDDLRYVDWSVYGRLDKLFIKLFHAQKGQSVHLLIDMSRSMGLGAPSKAITAKKIAAALSYICLSNLDKITLMAFNNRIMDLTAPPRGKKRFSEVLGFLASLTPSKSTALDLCLSQYASIGKHPGIAIVISDLFDPQGYENGLKALLYRNFDIHVLQVLDHEELFWSQTGDLLLVDPESGRKKNVSVNPALHKQYQDRLTMFLGGIQGYCSRHGIHYCLCDTCQPFEDFLMAYLTGGAARR
jgi:uncharacterized protein (DUF58 family)